MGEIKCPRCGANVTQRDVAVGCCPDCSRMFPEETRTALWGDRSRREPIFISYPGQARRVFVSLVGALAGLVVIITGLRASVEWSAGLGLWTAGAGASMTAVGLLCLWATLTSGWPLKIDDDSMVYLRQILFGGIMLHLGVIVSFTPPEWVVKGSHIPVAWLGYVCAAGSACAICWISACWFRRIWTRDAK